MYTHAKHVHKYRAKGGSLTCMERAHRLPVAQLRARLPLCVRALLALVRVLPPHAAAEQRRLRETLTTLLTRCLPPAQPDSAEASAPAEPMDSAGQTTEVRSTFERTGMTERLHICLDKALGNDANAHV